jgi:hypothetical protein
MPLARAAGRALHLASRERARLPLREPSEPDGFERGLRARGALGAADAQERQRQRDVLAHIQVRQEVEGLEDEAHVASAPERQRVVIAVVERLRVEADFARVGAIETRDDVEQRGFAGARLPGDGDPFAARDLEIDGVEERHTG